MTLRSIFLLSALLMGFGCFAQRFSGSVQLGGDYTFLSPNTLTAVTEIITLSGIPNTSTSLGYQMSTQNKLGMGFQAMASYRVSYNWQLSAGLGLQRREFDLQYQSYTSGNGVVPIITGVPIGTISGTGLPAFTVPRPGGGSPASFRFLYLNIVPCEVSYQFLHHRLAVYAQFHVQKLVWAQSEISEDMLVIGPSGVIEHSLVRTKDESRENMNPSPFGLATGLRCQVSSHWKLALGYGHGLAPVFSPEVSIGRAKAQEWRSASLSGIFCFGEQ